MNVESWGTKDDADVDADDEGFSYGFEDIVL